jgi:tetratricopeptide (TPR) repeat protein
LDMYDIAIEKDPYNLIALRNKGDLLLLIKDYNKALQCFDAILQMKEDANIYNYKGVVYERIGDFKRSLACFRKAYELSPETLLYKQNIISALLLNGEYDLSRKAVEEQELIIPSPWTAKMIGHFRLLEGDTEKAQELYDIALGRLSDNEARVEMLNEMLEVDLETGRRAFPDRTESIDFFESFIRSRLADLST